MTEKMTKLHRGFLAVIGGLWSHVMEVWQLTGDWAGVECKQSWCEEVTEGPGRTREDQGGDRKLKI